MNSLVLTFILVLSIWTDRGQESVMILDSGMTGEDCIELLIVLEPAVKLMKAIAACEIDHGEY